MGKQRNKKAKDGIKKTKSISTRIAVMCILISIIGCSVSAGGAIFITGKSNETKVASDMTALAQQVRDTVDAEIYSDFSFLEGLATSPLIYDRIDFYTQKLTLMQIAKNRGVADIGFVNAEGNTMTGDLQTIVNLADRKYVVEAMAGNVYASDPLEDPTRPGEMIMMWAVPVYENGDKSTGNIVGVLYQKTDGNYLSNLTNNVSFGETGFAYMINSIGTNIAYKDAEKVLNQENAIEMFSGKEEFESLIELLQLVLSDKDGYSTYTYNDNQKCVGYAECEYFGWHVLVSADQSELFSGQNSAVRACLAIMIVVIIIATIISVLYSLSMVAPLRVLSELNQKLAEGDLTYKKEIKAKRSNDEIGRIASSTDAFVEKLKEVLFDTQNSMQTLLSVSQELNSMATQSHGAAESVQKAIEYITSGTIEQADEVATASQEVSTLATAVDQIKNDASQLMQLAELVQKSEDNSNKALTELIESNEKTTESFNEISSIISETNEAIQKISKATDLITEIAEQTNLLALNATIEAARAGSAGKGFSVIASEIQTLAVQSNDSANNIHQIILELTNGSKRSVEKMNETLELAKIQKDRLTETKEESDIVNVNIVHMQEEAGVIAVSADQCASVKDKVSNLVMSLSSIAEQTAASTQETNASMQELNANIGIIANSSEQLTKVADELGDKVSYWKL